MRFSAIRRLPFFEFSTEEIVAAMVGRAAVRGKPCEALQCCACGAHGDWADNGTLGGFEEDYIEDSFNVVIRDSRCTICYMGIWMDGGPLNSFLRGEIVCPMCNRVYSNGLACGDDMAKVFRISKQGIEVEPGGWREGGLFQRVGGKIDDDDDDDDREDQMVEILPPSRSHAERRQPQAQEGNIRSWRWQCNSCRCSGSWPVRRRRWAWTLCKP
jgi:hypothetical protein